MSYLVLARKYRPKQFAELVGQAHISTTLLNAFKQNKLGQAYLFTGTRGVGKTSAARIMAKALRCEAADSQVGGKNRGMPCDACPSCLEINNGSSIDVLEIDGASNNGVDNVREIRESVKFLPSRGTRKVYIIDEVHMLTGAAFNALLKTLEEPPAHVIFLLATTEVQKIPATILSRCQRFDFKRVPAVMIFEHLLRITQQEGIHTEPDALRIIARKGEGSMRDALSTLDQALALAGKDLTVAQVTAALGIVGSGFLTKILGHLLEQRYLEAVQLVHEAFDGGIEMKQLAIDLAEQIRNALFVKLQAGDSLSELSKEEKAELEKIVEKVSPETLQVAFRMLSQSLEEIIRSPLPRASLEMALLRIYSLGQLVSLQNLMQQVQGSSPISSVPASTVSAALKPAITSTAASPNKTLDWAIFVSHAGQVNPSLGAILEHAVLQSAGAAAIVLGFRKKHSFYQLQLQHKANFDALEKTLFAFLGRKCTIKMELLPDQAADISLVEKEEKNTAEKLQGKKDVFLKHDIVRQTEEIFGAQLSSFDIDSSKV